MAFTVLDEDDGDDPSSQYTGLKIGGSGKGSMVMALGGASIV